MRKYNNIFPKRRLIKKSMLSLKLMLWLKAIIACYRHDNALKKEVNQWPDGFSVFFKIFKDKPFLGIQKNQGSLHIIKSTISFCDEILLSFKSLDVAYAVFSGKTFIRQALIERRFDITGSPDHALSFIRAVVMAENILFRSKINRGRSGVKLPWRVSRIAILTEILRIRIEGKEVSPYDSKILRVS
jgi:hypothetical protein